MSLDEQSPGGYDPKRYIVLINNAIANAKVADKSKGWFPVPGNTKIYELAESLMKFVSVREFNDFVERMRSDLG